MKYKGIIAAAAVCVAMSMSICASAANFQDTEGHWAEATINTLADKGVVHGVSDTEFNPDGQVTRAEFLKMALSAAGIEESEYRSGECLDVTESDWYGGCVQSALDKGLIPQNMIEDYSVEIEEDENGSKAIYSGSFNSTSPIKREEMAYMTQAVYQYSLGEDALDKLEEPVDMDFSDVKRISSWAFDGVRHAYANDFIFGMEDGSFKPQDTATRAQAAVIIKNLMDKE